jgi:hypothetical protein
MGWTNCQKNLLFGHVGLLGRPEINSVVSCGDAWHGFVFNILVFDTVPVLTCVECSGSLPVENVHKNVQCTFCT